MNVKSNKVVNHPKMSSDGKRVIEPPKAQNVKVNKNFTYGAQKKQ